MQKAVLIFLVLTTVSACSFIKENDEKPELTSPCVGLEGSPCGPKRPANMWLYEQLPS